jgi:probable addiction module antidote protein
LQASKFAIINLSKFSKNAVTRKAHGDPKERRALSAPEVDSSRFRDNPDEIARYLTEAFASDDFPTILAALSSVVRAQNVMALSRATGLRRERFYRPFSGTAGPDLGAVIKLLEGLGVKFKVESRKNPKPKPPLPKLGRPVKSQIR